MLAAMTSTRLLVHTSRQTVRWADMDALGHVNNTVYFRYMEQARLDWLFGHAGPQAYGTGSGPVIANAICNFLRPLVFPADIDVAMYLGGLRTTSMTSYYEITSGDVKYADGEARIVWIDLATGRPTPLPADIVAPLRALASEAQ